MRIATLFSGIGAPEQAGHRLGYESVFACEWDEYARQSFLANYDLEQAHFHKDVYDLDATLYRDHIDILIGGSPCQAFSIAGLRKGLGDKRGELIYEYIRVVDEVHSPYIVYENVKGMMSIDKGRTIKEFVQALRDIGYHCHYSVINSKDYGIPQNRERLFLVGFLDVEQYHAFSFAPKVKLTKSLKDVLESEVDEKYYLKNCTVDFTCKTEQVEGLITSGIEGNDILKRVYKTDTFSPTIHTMQGGNQEPKILAQRGHYNEDGSTSQRLEYRDDEVTNTITCVTKDNLVQVKSATIKGYEEATEYDSINLSNPNSETRRGRVGKQVAQTLDCACNQAVVEPYRIRKFTPRECLRLQDFPDTFTQVVSNSQLYKQAGNSMTVAVLEMIFKQIEKARSKEMGGLFGSVA